jgi:hypothetical protein
MTAPAAIHGATPYIAQFKTKLANARLGKQYHNNVKPRHFNALYAWVRGRRWWLSIGYTGRAGPFQPIDAANLRHFQ